MGIAQDDVNPCVKGELNNAGAPGVLNVLGAMAN
jgi:hypothetical protein